MLMVKLGCRSLLAMLPFYTTCPRKLRKVGMPIMKNANRISRNIPGALDHIKKTCS
jgi:hypothetical protein